MNNAENAKVNEKKIRLRLRHIKERCYNPRRKDYKYYGGRGIAVCEEWRKSSFRFYLWFVSNLKGVLSRGVPVERIDVDRVDENGDYSPENCILLTHRDNVTKAIRRNALGRFSAHTEQ